MTNKTAVCFQAKSLNDTTSRVDIVIGDSLKNDTSIKRYGSIIDYSNIDTTKKNQEQTAQEKEVKIPDWSKCSYYATLADVIFTFLGIIAALATLLWMYNNSKGEKQQVKQQLFLLEQGNNQAKLQIQNQERALKDSAEKSRTLNEARKESVEDIKKYLTQSDLKVKLTEKKDTVNSTFNSLWNSVLRHGGSMLKDGSIINNSAVLNGIITMETCINTFNDLLPIESEKCEAAGRICLNDIDCISKKKKQGDDIAQWLKDMKNHFDDLNNEMSNCINSIK